MRPMTKVLPIAVAFVAAAAHLAAAQQIVIDKMWSTTWNYSKVQELSNPAIKFVAGTPLAASVNVTSKETAANPDKHDLIGVSIQENQVHQMVDSFGGGITDSVAITLQDFKTKHPKDYDDLLHLLFSTDPAWFAKGGVGMNTVRVPLGACDFGVSPYTYDDTEDGSEDMKLELFTIKKAPKLWMTLKDIVAINPALKIVVAAWSAPGWMKENTNADQPLFGGNLKAGMEQVYANYLIKSVVEIKRQEGLDIFALSPANEPQIPELQYPTMKLSADQSIQLGKLLRTGLDKAGHKSVKLFAWDHNWDNTDYPLQVLDADPTPWSAVAWHGYAGQPSAQKVVYDAYPSLDVYFTEHTQVTQWFSEPYKNMKNSARDLLIGSIRYMSRSVIMWNLVLRKDEDGFTTPHLPNVCMNCNAAILLLPESTDADLNSGDPNHTKTVAEANGASTTAEKKDAPAAKRKRQLRRRADTAVAPAVASTTGAGAGTVIKPLTTVEGVHPQTDDSAVTKPAPADGTKPKTVTFHLTGAMESTSTGTKADQAVLASKVVDAKKTGNPDVYQSTLFKRTSDLSVLSHLSTAVRPTGASTAYSKRIGVKSTDELGELGGRLLAQAFRQDGVKPGVSRFSLILLNQNDHYETDDFEAVTTEIAFRGMVANVTTVPGLYTVSWEAPTDAGQPDFTFEGAPADASKPALS
ncbi:related to beta-1,6-glucanase precursor [Sporisorium reilianum f. sp. reilianum]|uniref:Related to beta-1,6-glucanase n=1 Tax=Sporisorium reilianum f. sp. reilianum TaxID=72559 RepID=A0A2N8UB85_9BASI|nr:related to beta-1,6-glucanase precursor [Sporisorium reilianum f. sp. reilianum]